MRYFFPVCVITAMLFSTATFAQETSVTVTPGGSNATTNSNSILIEGLWRSDNGLVQAEKLLSEKKYNDALSMLDQVISRHPRSADAYVDSAFAWLNLKNNEKAKQAVDNALLIDKTHMGAYVVSGLIALMDKDRAQAENYLSALKMLCRTDNCPEFQILQRIIRETKPE